MRHVLYFSGVHGSYGSPWAAELKSSVDRRLLLGVFAALTLARHVTPTPSQWQVPLSRTQGAIMVSSRSLACLA